MISDYHLILIVSCVIGIITGLLVAIILVIKVKQNEQNQEW